MHLIFSEKVQFSEEAILKKVVLIKVLSTISVNFKSQISE